MMNTGTRDLYREQFAQLESRRAGAGLPWLKRTRAVAFERFAELGFPTLRDEDWKFAAWQPSRSAPSRLVPESLNSVRADQVAPLALGDSHLLVFVNGVMRQVCRALVVYRAAPTSAAWRR